MRRVKITNRDVVLITLAVILFFTVYLAIYTGVGIPHFAYEKQDLQKLERLWYPRCTDTFPGFGTALYITEGLALLQGARLCWATKDVPDAVNDSKSIATAMYVIIFVSAIVFPIVFLIKLDPQTAELITGIGFSLANISAQGALFLPKALLLWSGAELDKNMNIIYPPGRGPQKQKIDDVNNNNNEANGGGRSDGAPIYAGESKLGKNKEENVKICKEQILKWQKMLLFIESRSLNSNSSNSSSSMGRSKSEIETDALATNTNAYLLNPEAEALMTNDDGLELTRTEP